MRRLRVGIDTGGTFTDVVALDEGTGQVVTPADPAIGFMAGIGKVYELLGGESAGPAQADLAAISHGTTVATNRLLEDRIGDLGFITTEGFEFMLEIARQSVPDGYGNSYFWVKPLRIVPAHRVRTVGGRLDHTGAQIRPFDEKSAVEAARFFRDQGIEAIGVCFLHSYADPSHELAMREVLRREHPDAVVSISSEVMREYREYERSVTTLVDAAVKPIMMRYLTNIAGRLAELDGQGPGWERRSKQVPFYVMKSNGGVLSAEEVVHQPITTMLSGPAAGALGAALIAGAAGHPSVITLDGGGTSTDVAVVLGGEPTLTTEGTVGRYPSRIPMIDIVTVGAGGGSIAWISAEGNLKVGPKSAGADPGPLCYGRGGTEPTITDAHLFLGRIPPHLLGGEIPLDAAAAVGGIEAIAAELGITPERAAIGILEISAWNQANAIRQITVKRGLDVRDYPVLAFGGSGALLICRLLDILGLPSAIIPQNPGNLSAFGLLTVDVRNDYVRTHVAKDADLDLAEADAIFAALTGQAAAALDREGFAASEHRLVRSADLRYSGQAFEVRVSVPDGPDYQAGTVRRFHEAHEKLYGYSYPSDARHPVEWVNLRVTGIGPIVRPTLVEHPSRDSGEPVPSYRPVFFDEDGGGRRDVPIYQRPDLYGGDVVHGPAVIQEFGSTVPLHPGFRATCDAYGNLIVERDL
jgi:N-methylhydantoinase A